MNSTNAKVQEKWKFLISIDSISRLDESNETSQVWNDFVKSTIPEYEAALKDGSVEPLPKMTSPVAGTKLPGEEVYSSESKTTVEEISPNLDTFSPRPVDADKIPSFASAMTLSASPTAASMFPVSPAKSQKSEHGANDRIWALFQREGFSRDFFQRVDVDAVAYSLLLFHRNILSGLPSSKWKFVSGEVLFAPIPASPLIEFFGSTENAHWLTHFIIHQILTSAGSKSRESDNGDDGRNINGSRTHVRSQLISRWAKVGDSSRRMGDECSWRAIMAALCSKSVARLEKAWKRVDSQSITIVKSWINDEFISGNQMIIPWCSDQRQKVLGLVPKIFAEKSQDWVFEPMRDSRTIYDSVCSAIASYSRESASPTDSNDEEGITRLSQFWQDASKSATPKSAQ